MIVLKYFFLTKLFLQINIYILIFSLFSGLMYLFFLKYYYYSSNYRFFFNFIFIKFIFLIFLILSFFCYFISLYFYLFYINLIFLDCFYIWPQLLCFTKIYFFNIFSWNWFSIYLTIDLFGYILYLLSYLIGFISFLVLDNRLNINKWNFIFIFHLFLIIIFFYITSSNIILFFFSYECLLIPSFFFIYFLSPNRKAIQTSLYFLIWTQIGSFLILCGLIFLIINSKNFFFFFYYYYNFSKYELWLIFFCLFLGFGFKIPIWPFHYWLTKTHVEAPSGFSIYLSGFLVKTALYGFYKFFIILNYSIISNIFITICILGIIDASIKMWGQVDLKKLIAYSTIQEMNLIFLLFCFGNSISLVLGIIFLMVHGFLSSWMFFMVDCIYRRFGTRSIIEISGLFNYLPQFCCFVILMVLFFTGLPGTLKFTVEFYLFSGILDFSIIGVCIILLITNILGLIGFSKNWFNLIFGISMFSKHYLIGLLLKREFLLIILCIEMLIGLNFFLNLLF